MLVIFPCEHRFHKVCVDQLVRALKIGEEEMQSCPVCGFLAIAAIDKTFGRPIQ
jgi:hypothetical protein